MGAWRLQLRRNDRRARPRPAGNELADSREPEGCAGKFRAAQYKRAGASSGGSRGSDEWRDGDAPQAPQETTEGTGEMSMFWRKFHGRRAAHLIPIAALCGGGSIAVGQIPAFSGAD